MAAAGKQTGIKKTTVKKQDKGRHKGGITHASIMADKSMTRSEKDAIIRILGLGKRVSAGKTATAPIKKGMTARQVRARSNRSRPGGD